MEHGKLGRNVIRQKEYDIMQKTKWETQQPACLDLFVTPCHIPYLDCCAEFKIGAL